MEAGGFSDEDFFRAIASSAARVLVIGRRALIVLGAPVMTSDYDVWLHIDDIEKFNDAFRGLDHVANKSPEEARTTGRYVLQNGEHIDVMVARAHSTPEGTRLEFEAAWSRRQTIQPVAGVEVFLPSIDDLITTKRWASRPRDVLDIQWLETLKRSTS